MRMTTQLSVSSAILAAVLSGCSQQQVTGGSQLSGSQQMAGSAQTGSQQQVETPAPVVQPKTVKPVIKAKPIRVYARGPKPKMAHSVKRSGMGSTSG